MGKISTRDLRIIEMRQSSMTFTEIGDQFDISRQRVEQILKRWRPDLTGWKARPGSRDLAGIQSYWDRPTSWQKYAAKFALVKRREGWAWADIADELGYRTVPGAIAVVRLYSKKTGEDMSDCFGQWNRRKFNRQYDSPSIPGRQESENNLGDRTLPTCSSISA